MKTKFAAIIFFLFCPVYLNAQVLFSDQNGQGSSFSSEKIESLAISVILPKALSEYKFDFIQVVMSPSYNPKMEWRQGWMVNELSNETLKKIALVPESKLVNGYGSSFILADIKDYPSAKGFNSFTLNVEVKIYKKTGESEETRWDDIKKKFITEKIFKWDEGELIASGSASFTAPKVSAEQKQGMDKDKAQKLVRYLYFVKDISNIKLPETDNNPQVPLPKQPV